jgi:hypothetical protein
VYLTRLGDLFLRRIRRYVYTSKPIRPTLTFVQTPEIVTADIFPQRKQHPNINDHFVQLSTVAGNGGGGASQGSELVNAHSNSNLRTSRILVEVVLVSKIDGTCFQRYI